MICYNASKNQIYYTSKQLDILLKMNSIHKTVNKLHQICGSCLMKSADLLPATDTAVFPLCPHMMERMNKPSGASFIQTGFHL